MKNITVQNKKKIMIGFASFFIAFTLAVFVSANTGKEEKKKTADRTLSSNVEISTVGEVGGVTDTKDSNSWPGEIISLRSLSIQPDREGTISEWYVRIGERVNAGDVIGRLSRPPQMPDAVMSLSEKNEELSMTRTNTLALRAYTEKRMTQLTKLREDTESSNWQKIQLIGGDGSVVSNATLSSISSEKKMAQVMLRGSIAKSLSMMTFQKTIPTVKAMSSVQLRPGIGATNSGLRDSGLYQSALSAALTELNNSDIVPEKTGLQFFDIVTKLVNASVEDGDMLASADLELLKDMIRKDQSEFIAILGEIKKMELENSDVKRMGIDTSAEIDTEIADLQKMLAMSEGGLSAKEKAYETVNNSINGGYAIVSPRDGLVSSIAKKPGEFVGPGMPVATVTTENENDVLVRMRIPNNIQKPKVGDGIRVGRPGFETDLKNAKIVGIGNSLDEMGTYMADAIFTETIVWPIGSFVRVHVPENSFSVLIKSSAVLWGEEGKPYVWAVSPVNRVYKKEIVIGRSIGENTELYDGLENGDRYLSAPPADVKEDTVIDGINSDIGKGSDDGMGGMIM
ncbi:MAG: HlyD family efflux transporter periplasmic adaptor subunit [Candidatus Parcubacteria bacterium]|nr:HlyD family efflux transporter periplasmic adaptor subunit [Candidatus Parcubacteria bacterium]